MKKLSMALTIALFASASVQMFGMKYEQYMTDEEREQKKREIERYERDMNELKQRRGTIWPVHMMEHPESRPYMNMQDRIEAITGEYTNRAADYYDPEIKDENEIRRRNEMIRLQRRIDEANGYKK
jgi:hypothetical protein